MQKPRTSPFDEPDLPSQAELAAAAEALHWYVVAQEQKVGLEYLRFLMVDDSQSQK